ncbi:MAG: hypothetical protein IT260_08470 [Saprospiraceae bacterium]|nr:hypothetical protein [Saprospiraceae bacterium]
MKTQSRIPALLLFSMLFPTMLFAQAPPSGIARAVCPGYRPAPDPASQPDSAFQYFDKTVRLLDAVPEPDGSVLVWCMASQGNNIITWSDSRPHSPDTLALFSARFNTRGQLDTNYGRQGWLQYQPPVFSSVEGAHVARQTDGKWLVAYEFTDKQGIILMRFDPDGQLDSSFRSGGYVYFTNDEANEDKLLHLSALPDGKIRLLASSLYGASNRDCRLIQLQPDGFRDTTFDADGVLRLLANQPWIGDCAVLPDGRITLSSYNYGWLQLHRFGADGRPDASFGSYGSLQTRFVSLGSGDFFTQLPNGGLCLRGYTSRFCETGQTKAEFLVEELDALGRPDSVFKQSGSPLWQETGVRYQHARNDTTLLSLSYDGDLWCSGPGCKGQGTLALGFSDMLGLEKIISAPTGHLWLFGDAPDGLLAVRLLPNGSLDPAFGLDSLALRAQGFRPTRKKEGAKTMLGLEELNPPSPLYSYVTVSSFSTAGMSQKDSAMVLQPHPSYHDKFKNGGPYPSYSVEYAAVSGKAGHNQHLCLSQETISAQAPGWAEIPAERLQGLSLINCRFEGVPADWRRFKNLELLEIRFATVAEARQLPLNQVLAWFPNLEVLILSVPGATEIPKGLLKLNKLRVLELHLPQLEHFPKEILRLRGLQELRLTFRCLEGLPPQLEQLGALEILDIKGEGPGATLQLPETLGRLSQLKELRLSNGARPAVLPLSLGQLTALNKLELINAGIEALPDSISQCLHLQELIIKTNGVFQGLHNSFFELQELETLVLDICQPAPKLGLQAGLLQYFKPPSRRWFEIRLHD